MFILVSTMNNRVIDVSEVYEVIAHGKAKMNNTVYNETSNYIVVSLDKEQIPKDILTNDYYYTAENGLYSDIKIKAQPTNQEVLDQLEIVKQGMMDIYIAIYDVAMQGGV